MGSFQRASIDAETSRDKGEFDISVVHDRKLDI